MRIKWHNIGILAIAVAAFIFGAYWLATPSEKECIFDSECIAKCPGYENICERGKCLLIDLSTNKTKDIAKCAFEENITTSKQKAGTPVSLNASAGITGAAVAGIPENPCVISKCDCDCYAIGQTPEETENKTCNLDYTGFASCELREGRCRAKL